MKKFTKVMGMIALGVGFLAGANNLNSQTVDASTKMVVKKNSYLYTSKLKRTNAYKTENGVRYFTSKYYPGTVVDVDNPVTLKGKQYYQVAKNKYIRTSNVESPQDYLINDSGFYEASDFQNADGSINQDALNTAIDFSLSNDPNEYWVDDSKSKNKLIKSARKLIGYFHYGAHAGFGNWKKPNKKGTTDCSGFVWLAMKRAGYNVGTWPGTTVDFEKDARKTHRYLKKISAKKARMGDVVIVNTGNGLYDNGHAAIIDGPYEGMDTQIIQMGGDHSSQSVHRSTLGYSLSAKLLKGRFTYARPVK